MTAAQSHAAAPCLQNGGTRAGLLRFAPRLWADFPLRVRHVSAAAARLLHRTAGNAPRNTHAAHSLRLPLQCNAVMCILKEYSPSCGVNEIYDGSFTGAKIKGQGVAAQLLIQNGFAVFSEQQLPQAADYFDRHRQQRG